jgi:hypothetical protein
MRKSDQNLRLTCPVEFVALNGIGLCLDHSRQARKNGLQLGNDLLLSSSSGRGLVVGISRADRHQAVVALEECDLCLHGQTRASTPVCVLLAENAKVDACKDVFELVRVVALCRRNIREVDVEEGIRREVGRAGVDYGGRDVERQVGVHLAVQRRRSVPRSRVAGLAREGNRRDFGRLHRVHGSADSSTEGHLDAYVATDIGASERELGLSTIPELGGCDLDALLDGSNWEAVYVVETGVRCVGSSGGASTRAGVVDAPAGVEGGWCRVGGSCFKSGL